MTLSGRINKWFLLHTILIVLLNSTVALICLFVIEDGFFNQELKQTARKLMSDYDLSAVHSITSHLSYYPKSADSPFSRYSFQPDVVEEVSYGDRYYHLLAIVQDGHEGLIVSDVTERMIVRHSLDDLMVLFLPLILVLVAISLVMSRFLSGLALKPFNQLVDLVMSGSRKHSDTEEIKQIQESDIRHLVLEIFNSWKERETLLNNQIQFNLGISHEIRTPLQVAKNALELIRVTDETSQRALSRLVRSHEKMENIGTAFLWLSSDNVWNEDCLINPIVDDVISHLGAISSKLRKSIKLNSAGDCYLNMPEEVAYVIIENTLNNALQHSSGEIVEVRIERDKLIIANEVSQRSENKGFGVGLSIIELLTSRFGLRFETEVLDSLYTFRLCK